MKKSNALMLSYIIFLAITMLAQLIFGWDGLDKIAMAATISGCFFAFADLFNWYVSYQMPEVEETQKNNKDFIKYFNAILNNICLDVDQCSKSITLLLPYRDSYDKINGLINASNNYVEGSQRHIIEIKECINQTVKIQSNLEKIRKRFSHIKNAEIAFATIGFITFFAIISFYEMMVFLIRFQSAATVFAFFIIMLNYYFRDVIEENFKKQTSDILSYIESAKKEIDKKIQDSRAFVILDEVEKLVKKIELMENTKNENIKQAKTTQP